MKMLSRSLSFLVLVVAFGFALGDYCTTGIDQSVSWLCTYSCCSYPSSLYCCADYVYVNYGSAYWYAWFLLSLFFFMCVCSCIGCGTYGYRRRYYVRHVNVAQPAVPVVVTTTSAGYQQVGAQPYIPPQQYGPNKNPPPYNPY